MNTNLLADKILAFLNTKHSRVYRNKPPKSPTFPYVVFNIIMISDTYPSNDYLINIDIFENTTTSIRAIETLADSIDTLNDLVIKDTGINAHFTRTNRQFVSSSDLIEAQMISIEYTARTYF
jgi:hypothetical protein